MKFANINDWQTARKAEVIKAQVNEISKQDISKGLKLFKEIQDRYNELAEPEWIAQEKAETTALLGKILDVTTKEKQK